MKIKEWTVTQAPYKYDIIWKHLTFPASQRFNRSALIIGIIVLLSFLFVIPVVFLEQTISIQPIDYQFNIIEIPLISDILNKNILLVLISTYFSPLVLYVAMYLILPIIIIRLNSLENNFMISKRENSIIRKNYISMITNNIAITGLTMMVLGNYLYYFVKTDSQHYKKYYEDA